MTLTACPDCDGTRVVKVRAHTEDCTPLRCGPKCPRLAPRECARCAQGELGEDLVN